MSEKIQEQNTLTIKKLKSPQELGDCSAADVADCLKRLLCSQEEVNMIFAAAPSQNEFLEALRNMPDIEWERINAFHMDEYIGLPQDAPQRFGTYLREHIMGCVPFRSVHYLDGSAQNILEECRRYAALLRRFPVDIVCLGIGENGHIAFNDPHTALFQDPEAVKRVTLDLTCRNQQVHDRCFSSLEVVPEQAVTLTIPSLFAGRYLFCMVPGEKKAAAVKRAVEGKIEEACPASILRRHPNAILYVDEASGALLGKDP